MHRNDKQHVLKHAMLAAAMAAALFSTPLATNAAGMGKVTVLSALGQPLRAELDITASREELASLAARVAPVEVFRQANVEYASILPAVRFSLDKRSDGKPYFRIQTDRAVNDPFIDFLVELSWSSGRLVREYSFLLDPPELKTDNVNAAVTVPGTQSIVDSASSAPPTLDAAAEHAQAKISRIAPTTTGKPKAASDVASSIDDTEGAANIRKVKRGDTLSKIAAESATAGVTLDQMLVALFNSNRDAFIGGNMNRLRAGRILKIPDAEKAAAIKAGEARKTVVVQTAAFNAYRDSLAASAANQVPLEQKTQQSSSGKITPKVEEKVLPASGQDKLQVSRSEAQVKAGKDKLSEEDIVARDKALKEANSRITELEKNLTDLKKLAELKSQSQAAVAKPAETPALAGKEITVAAPAPAVPAVVATPETPAASTAAAAPAADKKLQPKPKKKLIPSPPPPEPSFVEDNFLLVYGGSAVVVAVLGFLGFRTWKRKRDTADADEGFTVNDLAASSVFGMAANEGATKSASSQSNFGNSTFGAVDSEKVGIDPIQEAEVYMAYGRDGQAEEILIDAMRKDPRSLAVYLKLLEIYAGRKSLPQFNELAGKLHALTSGNGSEWGKAAVLGRSLDPANPLYSGVAEMESALPVVKSDSANATIILQAPSLQEAPVKAAPTVEEEVPNTLDFDIDLGNTAPAASVQAPVAVAATMTASDLDFDLDLGSDEKSTEETAQSGGLDFDIDLGKTEPAPARVSAATTASDLDFDLDLGSDEKPAAEAAQSGGLDINMDASAKADNALDFDFDLGASEPGSIEQPSLPVDLSSINLDLGEPTALATVGNAGDSSEVATKLELAHAYEEMGDRKGARELLQEVLGEGSPAQQETARNKLAQLG